MRKLFVSAIALMAIATTSGFATEATPEKAPATVAATPAETHASAATQAPSAVQTAPQTSNGVVVPAEKLLDNPTRFAGAFTEMFTGDVTLMGDSFGFKIKITTELAKAFAEKDSAKIKSLILKKEGVDPAIAKILETAVDAASKSISTETFKKIADYQKIMYGEGAEADKKPVTFLPADSMDSWLTSTDLKKDVEQLLPKSEKKLSESVVVKERKAMLGILKISPKGEGSFVVPENAISNELGFLSKLDGSDKAIKELLKEKETKTGSAKDQIKEIKDLDVKNADLQKKIDEEKAKIAEPLKVAEKALADANAMPDTVTTQVKQGRRMVSSSAPNAAKAPAIKSAEDKIAEMKKGYADVEKELAANSEKIKSLSESETVKDSLVMSRMIDRQIVPQLEKVQKLFEGHVTSAS